MSTTTNDDAPADRGAPTHPGILGKLCAAWRRWRARRCKAGGVFTAITLALFAITACNPSEGSPTLAITAASTCPGSISVAWSIINASGQPLSCSQAGATSVALRLQSRTGGTPVFTAFPCTSSPGTANIAPGLYDVAIELHDANGAKLATAEPQTSIAIALARTKVLTPVAFRLGSGGDGGGGSGGGGGGGSGGQPGSVHLSLQAGAFRSNCLPSALDGAAITGTSITVQTAGGVCAPVTFIRSQGGTEIGTYKVNCSSPQITSCIESDESLTSPELTPGSYVIHARGKIGAGDCFVADTALEVPQTGPLQKQIVMQRQNVPGC
jgi:hypothetical protein